MAPSLRRLRFYSLLWLGWVLCAASKVGVVEDTRSPTNYRGGWNEDCREMRAGRLMTHDSLGDPERNGPASEMPSG